MTQDELNEKIDKLEKKKVAFSRNRNISAVATVFLGYNFYDTLQTETPPLWFYFAMSAIVLTCAGVSFYGYRTVKKITEELATLYAALQELQNEVESIEE